MIRSLELHSASVWQATSPRIIRLDSGDKQQQAGTTDSSGAARDNGSLADNPLRGTKPDQDKTQKNSGSQSK